MPIASSATSKCAINVRGQNAHSDPLDQQARPAAAQTRARPAAVHGALWVAHQDRPTSALVAVRAPNAASPAVRPCQAVRPPPSPAHFQSDSSSSAQMPLAQRDADQPHTLDLAAPSPRSPAASPTRALAPYAPGRASALPQSHRPPAPDTNSGYDAQNIPEPPVPASTDL